MANLVTRLFNRATINTVSTVDLLSSINAVDLKIDPSQQMRIYGISYGYLFPTDSDRLSFQQSYAVGYLDFQRDPNTFSFNVAATPQPELGEVFFIDVLSSSSSGPETFKTIDFSNPLVINGDRRATIILSAPDLSGLPVDNIIFILEVRGEVTQLSDQNKQRLGDWIIR